MITRHSYIVQGFVCPQHHHEECKNLGRMHQHGNHGNEWLFEVKRLGVGGMYARYMTYYKPDHVPEEVWKGWGLDEPRDFTRAGVVYHCPWPLSKADVLDPDVHRECKLAEPCAATREAGHAAEGGLYALLDRESFEQPEKFWKRLEDIFEKQVAMALEVKGGLVRCEACKGGGVVETSHERPK